MAKQHFAGKQFKKLRDSKVELTKLDIDKLADISATAAEVNLLSGAGAAVASGTQESKISDIAITYSANDPSITPDGAVTVADGSAATVAELLELAEELISNQNAIIDALEAFGLSATS